MAKEGFKDITIPSLLHRELKVAAAQEGVSLQQLARTLLKRGLRQWARDQQPSELRTEKEQ